MATASRHKLLLLGLASLLIVAVAVVLAAGGASDGGGAERGEPVPGETTIERDGDVAATLHVEPSALEAGETLRVRVENLGSAPLTTGFGSQFERFVDGRWKDVKRRIGPRAVPLIAIIVQPGQRKPLDRIELPDDLKPGIYRALKGVSDDRPEEPRPTTLTLTAVFEVLGPQRARDLWGRTFTSTAVTEEGEPRPLVSDTRIEVRFTEREDRGIGWQGGCNSFGTDVEITADRLLLADEIVGTEIGCGDDLLEQDAWLTRFLSSDPRWGISDDRLTLTSGETVIELEASRG